MLFLYEYETQHCFTPTDINLPKISFLKPEQAAIEHLRFSNPSQYEFSALGPSYGTVSLQPTIEGNPTTEATKTYYKKFVKRIPSLKQVSHNMKKDNTYTGQDFEPVITTELFLNVHSSRYSSRSLITQLPIDESEYKTITGDSPDLLPFKDQKIKNIDENIRIIPFTLNLQDEQCYTRTDILLGTINLYEKGISQGIYDKYFILDLPVSQKLESFFKPVLNLLDAAHQPSKRAFCLPLDSTYFTTTTSAWPVGSDPLENIYKGCEDYTECKAYMESIKNDSLDILQTLNSNYIINCLRNLSSKLSLSKDVKNNISTSGV